MPETPHDPVHELAHAAVQEVLAKTPPHHDFAAVVTTDEVRAGYGQRTNSGWDFAFDGGFDKQAGINAGFKIGKSW